MDTNAANQGKVVVDDFEDKELYFKTLLESLEGNKELLSELSNYAIDFFPAKYIELEDAVALNDYINVKEIAHSIKGEVSYFKSHTIHKLAQQIEDMGSESNLNNIQEVLIKFKKAIDNLTNTLSQINDKL